jgi:aspartate carbamoyltransferase catalytic subunit
MDKMKHVLKAQQFDKKTLKRIFEVTDKIRENPIPMLKNSGLIMSTLFYEPSTRTRFSFEAAMKKLGGDVLSTENAENFSSTAKGELLEDSVRTVAAYSDVIVLRHPKEGAAEAAALVCPNTPIINAGDGEGQHPTQALLDLYTIRRECGGVNGKSIALVGDLAHSRTIHSLLYLLTKYKNIGHLYLVAPEFVKLKRELLLHVAESDIPLTISADLKEVAPKVDVIYQTRLQKERFNQDDFAMYQKYHRQAEYRIDADLLKLMKPDARILHPLPRVNELLPEVDNDPRAAYFRQVENGLYIRMALLVMLLSDTDFILNQ